MTKMKEGKSMKRNMTAFFLLLAAILLPPAHSRAQQATPVPEAMSFVLAPGDIESWSQVKDGKFIEIDMSAEKKAEIETLTAANTGKPLDIRFAGAIIHAGIIEEPLKAEDGFVLVPQEDQRQALLGLLDPAKEKKKAPAHLGLGAKGGTEAEKAKDAKPAP